jgi:hypothetical protein
MTDHRARYGSHNPDDTYVGHDMAEQVVDLGEVQMNFATAGVATAPALLLILGQTLSWWGYEAVMSLLADWPRKLIPPGRSWTRSAPTPNSLSPLSSLTTADLDDRNPHEPST